MELFHFVELFRFSNQAEASSGAFPGNLFQKYPKHSQAVADAGNRSLLQHIFAILIPAHLRDVRNCSTTDPVTLSQVPGSVANGTKYSACGYGMSGISP